MGLSILDYVLQQLRDAGFTADVAFPGQKYPPITETVAAVHIAQVDRANMTVTVEVTVICPAALGGTACETQALKATEVLRWAGAECIQKGCAYDGMAQVYCVDVLATFTCVTEADDCRMGPGFAVYVNGVKLEFLTGFSACQNRDVVHSYEMGYDYPVAICMGKTAWQITIQEVIPAGSDEVNYAEVATEVLLEMRNGDRERYCDCYFHTINREHTNQGLKRTWKGICLKKVVSSSEQNYV